MSAKTLSNRPKLNTLKFWTYQDCSKSYELRSQDCTRSGDHSTVATLRLLLLLFCRVAGPPPPTGSPGSPPPPFICDGTCSSFWVSLNYISSWNNREDYATCHMCVCVCVKITQKNCGRISTWFTGHVRRKSALVCSTDFFSKNKLNPLNWFNRLNRCFIDKQMAIIWAYFKLLFWVLILLDIYMNIISTRPTLLVIIGSNCVTHNLPVLW